jgi:FkbM family methyltransferase
MVGNGRLWAVDGQVYNVLPDMYGLDYFGIAMGRYERAEIETLKRRFRNDHTIIEIGANIGVLARHAFMEKLEDGGTYICVEPNKKSLAVLEANMRRGQASHPKKDYRIVGAAVCGPELNNGYANFCVRRDLASGLEDFTTPGIHKTDHEAVVQIPTRSLGSLMDEYAPHGASLICDVEGAEISIIFKDPEAFDRIGQILIELHGPSHTGLPETPDDMLKELKKLGFVYDDDKIDNCYYLSRPPDWKCPTLPNKESLKHCAV